METGKYVDMHVCMDTQMFLVLYMYYQVYIAWNWEYKNTIYYKHTCTYCNSNDHNAIMYIHKKICFATPVVLWVSSF